MRKSYTVPPALIDNLRAQKCAVFVGAGLSRRVGYTSWSDTLVKLIERAIDRNLLKRGSSLYRALLQHAKTPSDALVTAQELSDLMGEATFRDELASFFNDDREPSEAHMKILKLPFTFAVTTNYDRLIENAYVKMYGKIPTTYTFQQAPDFASALWRGDYFILKAHGDVGTRSSMIITEMDYRKLVYSSAGYRATMGSVFTMKTLLFMGASLNDPEMRLLLSFLFDAFHGGGPTHYAFVSRKEFSEVEIKRWQKDYKVQCILYDPSDTSHPEVDYFLDELLAELLVTV